MHNVSELPTAESFALEEPIARIIGTETEFDIRMASGDLDYSFINAFVSDRYFKKLKIPVLNHASQSWPITGGRLYYDVGHAEYCTPEVLGPLEAIKWTAGGIALMAQLAKASEQDIRMFRRNATVHPTSGSIASKGYHTNFITAASVVSGKNREILASHLATAFHGWGGILTAAGFNIAPRAVHTVSAVDGAYGNRTSDKAMAVFRPQGEDTTGNIGGFVRLENMSQTPGSPFSDFLAMASTSLILRVLEHPEMLSEENERLRNLILRKPVAAHQRAAYDLGFTNRYDVANEKQYSALDIQEELASIAVATCAKLKLPDDEQFGAHAWLKVVHDMKRVVAKQDSLLNLADRIGWVEKYTYLASKLGEFALKFPTPNDVKAYKYCLLWDRIYPTGAGQLHNRAFGTQLYTPAEAEFCSKNGPTGTRAEARSAYVLAHHKDSIRHIPGWGYLKKPLEGGSYEMVNPSPYQTNI